jgi:hypothetical protein
LREAQAAKQSRFACRIGVEVGSHRLINVIARSPCDEDSMGSG